MPGTWSRSGQSWTECTAGRRTTSRYEGRELPIGSQRLRTIFPLLQVIDFASRRTFHVTKSASFPDAVVWNPWVEKSAKMADFGDSEFKVSNSYCLLLSQWGAA